jgi:hypothetical protein
MLPSPAWPKQAIGNLLCLKRFEFHQVNAGGCAHNDVLQFNLSGRLREANY